MIDTLASFFTDPRQLWQLGATLALLFIGTWLGRAAARLADRRYVVTAGFSFAAVADTFLRAWLAPIFIAAGSCLVILLLARSGLPDDLPRVLMIFAATLVGVRVIEFLVRRVWRPGSLMSIFTRIVTWVTSLVLTLVFLGWLDDAARVLDSIVVPLGKSSFSLLAAGRVILATLAFLVLATYLGVMLEKRVMRVSDVSIGIRVGIVKFSRFFLVVVAIWVALNTVGVDLTALAVLGGAIGVGIGFGLQRVASNFISGFVLVSDRSIRQGDVISIGSRFGVVRELRARYVVVRDRDGVDTLIPNENLITSEVVNWSYADRNVRLKLPVTVSYSDNPRNAMELMLKAAQDHPRVEKAPAPAARVIAFGENGIQLELRFWIRDPEDGINNVRSDLFLGIWDAFEAAGITIPFPQRDVRLHGGNVIS